MIDFAVFDSILDSIFVIDTEGKIVYCNDAAATFCQTSVRRVAGKALLGNIIQFGEPGIFPFNTDSPGRAAPTPFIETPYNLPKAGKAGKVQMAIRPIDASHWGVFIKDVSLEETLAAKYRGELAKTEEYARNLEKLVEARTVELRKVNQTLNAILNSLGQGFFTFNSQGDCGSVYTRICEDVLEGIPQNRKAWEVLAVPDRELGQFKKWMETSFQEPLPFDDLKGLGPNLFPHSQQKHVVLDYYPIRPDASVISEIVVVATDKTTEHQAQMDLEAERLHASMVVKYLKNKDQFMEFLSSVRVAVKNLKLLLSKEVTSEGVNEAFRVLHTLEGEAGTFSLKGLKASSREVQHLLEPFKGKGGLPEANRPEVVASLNELHLKFEQFLIENQSVFKLNDGDVSRMVEMPLETIEAFLNQLKSTPGATALVKSYSDFFLMVPIETRLKYFDSLIQSVAEKLGKKVKPLVIEGGDLRIYPEPYKALFSALVHTFRNAVDHGLEEPTEREWGGKDPAGLVKIQVSEESGGLRIVISDDGRGIDPVSLRVKLKEKFPERDFTRQTDEEVVQNVFLPGFSSRDSVGEFSGRGVGLDALREEVLNKGGTVFLRTQVGIGTSIEIFVPSLTDDKVVLRSA
jgi:two-component system chemotaxis sensor kinase CheA